MYDSAAKIDGISGEATVLRAETDASGKTLNVAENFFVQNASAPPRTEYGGNTFDFYLPKGAVIVQTLASSPGGLPTNTEVKTLDAANGHYAFTFPVRPGETRFQVAYSMPYNGKQAFSLKLTVPTGDVRRDAAEDDAVPGFGAVPAAQPGHERAELRCASAGLRAAGGVQHQRLGPVAADAGGRRRVRATNPATARPPTDSRPGGGLGAPDDPNGTNDPWAQYKWWILGVLGLALVLGAGVMLKAGQPNAAVAVAGAAPPLASAEGSAPVATQAGVYAARGRALRACLPAGPGALLHALKDELFVLETDRLAGRLSEAEYAEHKAAFDVVLRRALARSEASPARV